MDEESSVPPLELVKGPSLAQEGYAGRLSSDKCTGFHRSRLAGNSGELSGAPAKQSFGLFC